MKPREMKNAITNQPDNTLTEAAHGVLNCQSPCHGGHGNPEHRYRSHREGACHDAHDRGDKDGEQMPGPDVDTVGWRGEP